MRNLQIEALFGGVLALVVIAVAVFAVANTGVAGAGGRAAVEPEAVPIETNAKLKPVAIASTNDADLVCECYDKAFSLAGKINVLSSDYRTGFEQCRARAGVDGGDAWTAGWEARLASRPYEASCKSYKRRRS
jgi:hypothetical protein